MMNNGFPDDSVRRFLATQKQREEFLRLGNPYASFRSALDQSLLSHTERITRLADQIDRGLHRHLTESARGVLDAHERLMRDATGPLMRLRAETLYETELARAASLLPKNYVTNIADNITQQYSKMLSDIAGAAKLTSTVTEQVRRALESQTQNRLADLAKPFASITDHLQRQFAGARAMLDAGEWARRLGVPLMDAASVATVARAWGAQGALRNLRELGGLDRETLRLIAAALEAGELEDAEESPGESGSEARGVRKRREIGGMSFSDIVAILSIVLTLLIWKAQNRDAEEMEARLRADNHALAVQVQQGEQHTARSIEEWSRLAEALIVQAQHSRDVQFVARSRGAQIKSKKGGKALVAEVLPGQVVTLIAEEGKWIEISYFDFASGKQQAGWALKKYFVRANAARSQLETEE